MVSLTIPSALTASGLLPSTDSIAYQPIYNALARMYFIALYYGYPTQPHLQWCSPSRLVSSSLLREFSKSVSSSRISCPRPYSAASLKARLCSSCCRS